MTLPNDYRPEDFGEMIGNEGMIKSLGKMMEREEGRPNCYLFTGPSGCGKTTAALIIKDMMNCDDLEFTEVNAADTNGIDLVRQIRKEMGFLPSKGLCRIWFFDECHRLTVPAQEGLLKAMENPPSHVVLIFATTEPEKLKITFKRRCTAYELEPVSNKMLAEHMIAVLKAEEKKAPKEVIKEIIKNSMGSPGIALGILDKVMELDEDEMLESVEKIAEEESQVIELCRAILNRKSWPVVAKILKGLSSEPESTRRACLGFCSSVLLGDSEKLHANAYLVMDAMRGPFYDTGKPGLTLACYEALNCG